jgi:Flp pilus assembly protein TadB
VSTEAAWWLTLGLGLVVAIVAVILLEIFLRQVQAIEAGTAAIWAMGKEVARNTVTTWMLQQTPERLDRLTEEALRHDALLNAALAGAGKGSGDGASPEGAGPGGAAT